MSDERIRQLALEHGGHGEEGDRWDRGSSEAGLIEFARALLAEQAAPMAVDQWQFRVKDGRSQLWQDIPHAYANELRDNPAFELRALSIVPASQAAAPSDGEKQS